MNSAISDFVKEMKSQKLWENVVLVTSSDFGRTITPNSAGGTDHGLLFEQGFLPVFQSSFNAIKLNTKKSDILNHLSCFVYWCYFCGREIRCKTIGGLMGRAALCKLSSVADHRHFRCSLGQPPFRLWRISARGSGARQVSGFAAGR